MGKPVCVVRNSKFCIDVLVDYSNRARSLFTIPIEDSIKRRELVTLNLYLFIKSYIIFISIFIFYSYFWTQIPRHVINKKLLVCDVTTINTSDCINNNRKQLESLTSILETLEKLESSDSLLLIGYPLLTQVNVGVFFILINMFLKVFIIYIFIIFYYINVP